LASRPAELEFAATALRKLTATDDWFASQLRHDGVPDFIWAPTNNPRAMRITSLFSNSKAHVSVGQILDVVGLGYFINQPGGLIGFDIEAVSKMPAGDRFEMFMYEFPLAGRSSFDFSVA
jgi:hypothetical protein